jgi:hypothetical protein
MLVAKLRVPEAVIPADAHDSAVVSLKLVLVVGKVGGFKRAMGRVVLGIKKENQLLLADVLRQVDLFHVGIGQYERGCNLSRL